MNQVSTACPAEIIQRGSVRAMDVARLHGSFSADPPATAEDIDVLFSIHEACPVQDPAWAEFFVEAVGRFIVLSREPAGYLTQAKAEWLIARLAKNGEVVACKIGIELLAAVLEQARWSPASLVRFALTQVEYAVRHGTGPLRAGTRLPRGTISEAEVGLLRRILCAFGGDEGVAITRAEIEVLLSIDEATADAPRNAAWTDLFVKAVTNALMSSSGHAVPSRTEALAPEPWSGFWQELWPTVIFATAAGSSFEGRAKYRKQLPEERTLAKLQHQRIEIITNEPAPFAEVGWLAQRLGSRGRPTAAKQALLAAVRHARPSLHPLLEDIARPRAA